MTRKRKPPIGLGGEMGPSTRKFMNQRDAENMIRLLHDLIAWLPHPFKERLKVQGVLLCKFGNYTIQISDKRRFPVY